MPQERYPTVPFPIDPIIARQHGGLTTFDNLALSCRHEEYVQPLTSGSPELSLRIEGPWIPLAETQIGMAK